MFPISIIKAFMGAAVGKVTTSGETVSHTESGGGTGTVGIKFNQDGTVDGVEDGSDTQVDSSTDWIIPTRAQSRQERIRFVSFVGDALFASATSENNWIDLTANRTWQLRQVGTGSKSCSFTIEIDDGNGTTLDTGAYALDVTVNA